MRGVEALLLAGWRSLWTGSAALSAAVPGGLWQNRAPELGTDGNPVATPYAEIFVKAEPAQYSSAPSYLQLFEVRVEVWSNAGPVNGGTIQAIVGRLFDPPAGMAVPPGLQVQGVQVIRVDAADSQFELDPARVKAGDILVATAAWNILLNIPR